MRTFYIFKIKKPYAILTKNNPYNLFKTIENIYYLKPNELKIGKNIFNQLRDTLNKDNVNNNIYEYYKNRYDYTKFNNTHTIIDYYTKEKTKLIVNKTFMVIKSTKQIPTFLKSITNMDNMFVCDFVNKDYFWLDKLA